MKDRQPTLEIKVYLVEIGYEIEIYKDGESIGFECRDFGDDRDISISANDFIHRLMKMVAEFRNG